jgi:hypothetical protein
MGQPDPRNAGPIPIRIRKPAGLPQVRVRDSKQAIGRRLRAAGMSLLNRTARYDVRRTKFAPPHRFRIRSDDAACSLLCSRLAVSPWITYVPSRIHGRHVGLWPLSMISPWALPSARTQRVEPDAANAMYWPSGDQESLLGTENLDAWSAYHLGLQHMYRFNRADNAAAAALFERAVGMDPQFARAHAGLSFTHFQTAFMRQSADITGETAAARRCAERALKLIRLTLSSISRWAAVSGWQETSRAASRGWSAPRH